MAVLLTVLGPLPAKPDEVLSISGCTQIDKLEHVTVMETLSEKTVLSGKLQGTLIWQVSYIGKPLHLSVCLNKIVFYTSENTLLILKAENGQLAERPLRLDKVAYFKHQDNCLLTINEFGWLQVFDVFPTRVRLKTDLKNMLIGHYRPNRKTNTWTDSEIAELQSEIRVSCRAEILCDGKVILQLDRKTSLIRHDEVDCWCQAPEGYFEPLGLPKLGVSSYTDQILKEEIYSSCPREIQKFLLQQNQESCGAIRLVAELEESLLLCILEKKVLLFAELLTQYCVVLAVNQDVNRLRSLVSAVLNRGPVPSPEHAFVSQVCGSDPVQVALNLLGLLANIPPAKQLATVLQQEFRLSAAG